MNQVGRAAFRPLDPEVREDPYPIYARLRREHPMAWATTPASGYLGFWFVSRYDDVVAGLKDNRFGRELAKVFPADAFPPIPDEHKPLYGMIANWMLFKDPPDHARLRRIAAPVFTLRAVTGIRPRLEALVAAALARLPTSGTVDIVSDFSSPLSIDIVSDLLGVPERDHPLIRGWVREITLGLDLVRTPERILAASARAKELIEYFRGLVAAHRPGTGVTLMDLLVQARADGEYLTDDELLASSVFFLFAGHEASSLLIGNGLKALAANPAQYAAFRDGRVPAKALVSELMRYDSPQQIAFRHALEDLEFRGTRIRKGQTIGFGLGAANRDPDVFPDPDRLDLARDDSRHLAFGIGIHTCAGSNLANLEAEIVFTELAKRLPELKVVGHERQESILVRGLTKLFLEVG